MTEIENIKTEAESAVELDGPADDDEYAWDSDEDDDEDGDGQDDDNETEPTAEEKIDMLTMAGTEKRYIIYRRLQEANERLLAALASTSEQLGELATAVESLQDEVEQY
jgi:hypothetical protein